MLNKLGLPGVVGLLLMLGGIGLTAWHDPIIAGALALIVAGLGLVVYGMVTNLVRAMGMGQMV